MKARASHFRAIETLIIAAATVFMGVRSYAEPIVVNRVLKDTTTMVALDLNEKTVFCTDKGYGNVQLKVSVPDLDFLAHFDHRVVGESQPCITGGACSETLKPVNFIDPNQKLALAPMRVILSEQLTIDEEKKTCQVILLENVKSNIRGQNFAHFRSGKPTNEDFDKCLKVKDL